MTMIVVDVFGRYVWSNSIELSVLGSLSTISCSFNIFEKILTITSLVIYFIFVCACSIVYIIFVAIGPVI